MYLAENTVHVWQYHLAAAGAGGDCSAADLCESEALRAGTLDVTRRRNFLASRLSLRRLLGRYLGCPPRQVPLASGARGKLFLATMDGALHFNTSHSGDRLMHAVARTPLGIDIERVQDTVPWTLSDKFLTLSEHAALRALPIDRQPDSFFAAWTRKEAYIKAHGGERYAHQFEVSMAPWAQRALVSDGVEPFAPLRWTVMDIDAGCGYRGALAIEGARPAICYR